jgi:hypothetical protein
MLYLPKADKELERGNRDGHVFTRRFRDVVQPATSALDYQEIFPLSEHGVLCRRWYSRLSRRPCTIGSSAPKYLTLHPQISMMLYLARRRSDRRLFQSAHVRGMIRLVRVAVPRGRSF